MKNNTGKNNSEEMIIIRPQDRFFSFDFRELWQYRELAYFFVWREIKLRYKQTIVGILWAIFQPFCSMVIFTIFFGKLAKIPSEGIPYPVFVFVGLLLWNYFSFGLTHASASVVSNANIIQKIYFPRLIIPLTSSLIGLVDLIIATTILVGLMFYYHFVPAFKFVFYIPLLILITFLSSVGIGSFLASLNVKYRDVKYAVPFFIQMLMFLTPVIYPANLLQNGYKFILYLNPMSAVIETARKSIFNAGPIDHAALFYAFLVSILFFLTGIIYFKKTEKHFADII